METTESPTRETPLPPPAADLAVVLVQPRIPQNVGAIGRLCAATASTLHIVRPIPFQLDDRSLRRAGMDYLEILRWEQHRGWEACREALAPRRLWFLSSKGNRSLWDVAFAPTDALIFGSESAGLPDEVWTGIAPEQAIRIPMPEPRARCLNLAQSAAVAVYEALRQVGAGER